MSRIPGRVVAGHVVRVADGGCICFLGWHKVMMKETWRRLDYRRYPASPASLMAGPNVGPPRRHAPATASDQPASGRTAIASSNCVDPSHPSQRPCFSSKTKRPDMRAAIEETSDWRIGIGSGLGSCDRARYCFTVSARNDVSLSACALLASIRMD